VTVDNHTPHDEKTISNWFGRRILGLRFGFTPPKTVSIERFRNPLSGEVSFPSESSATIQYRQ
jgi:hypothetical protein